MSSPDYVEVLEQRLQEVTAEINELQTQVKEIYAVIISKQEQAQGILQLLSIEGHQVSGIDIEAVGQVNLSDIVFEYLQKSDSKKPIHYRELAEGLLSRGTVITGKDPAANLLSHISRDDRFVRTAPGTYGLSEWGLKPSKSRRKTRRRKTRK